MPFIKLKRSAQSIFVNGRTQGFRMTVEATEADGVDKNIFVYQRFPQIDPAGEAIDGFVNIASPSDLEEYLVNSIADATRPFYRDSAVDLVFRSEDLLQAGWIAIQADVNELVRSLTQMQTLGNVVEVSFGSAASSSSSST